MINAMDADELRAYRALEKFGPVNTLTLYSAGIRPDAVGKLLRRGILEEFGASGVRLADSVKLEAIASFEADSAVRKADDSNQRQPSPRKNRKATYSPLTGMFPDRIKQLASRVVHWIKDHGEPDCEYRPTCKLRDLERGLHADRFPEWFDAKELLLRHRKAIEIHDGVVTLTDLLADDHLPDPFDPLGKKARAEERQARRASSRPTRPLSEWVKRRIRERGGTIPGE